mmetsp:Transcript_42291/g.77267  ORF Transcript_42291/g.77267 Transcript_42291/m.77267 type:complete len:143 (-) Transcript_42291:254-682(-)
MNLSTALLIGGLALLAPRTIACDYDNCICVKWDGWIEKGASADARCARDKKGANLYGGKEFSKAYICNGNDVGKGPALIPTDNIPFNACCKPDVAPSIDWEPDAAYLQKPLRNPDGTYCVQVQLNSEMQYHVDKEDSMVASE